MYIYIYIYFIHIIYTYVVARYILSLRAMYGGEGCASRCVGSYDKWFLTKWDPKAAGS